MTVSWEDVRSWNPAEVSVLAQRVKDSASALTDHADESARLLEQLDWHGPAADAARSAVLSIRGDLVNRAQVLLTVGRCVEEASTSMYPLVSTVRRCTADATEHTMDVEPDGTVVDALPVYTAAAADAWSIGRDRLRHRREIQARVTESIRRATELDDRIASELRAAQAGAGTISAGTTSTETTGAGTIASLDVSEQSPASNAAFWESSTPADRTALLVRDPGRIGNLDGIPAGVRDAANRRMLTLERTRLREVADDLRKRLDHNVFGGLFDNADVGLEQTEKRLKALDAVSETLALGNRQLLVLDNSSGEDTLAAIAVGNVDTATHVAVFVPGLGSDVEGDIGRYDGDMESLEAVAEDAVSPPDTVACVTWMNYEAPHTGWSVLDPNRSVAGATAAVVGAARLRTFLDGLDASRRSDPHLSLVGHSYGSLTAAHAVRGAESAGVDDMVVVGSPGLGVGTVHELSVPPGHLFVGEAADDIVADLGAFGADPNSLDGVRTLPTGAEGDLDASNRHSQYFTDGTTSQHAVALVVAGRGNEVG